ncbi:magnesium transporter [Gloeobacter kilaueensis]|uniref:Magnesium transporter MgtE n=1 Tax=Gloeobacter kilaueensis (strain ATCC BAA-2537 / CCAP 1431/1 / ULC 316 / JS1) TaxID=1183438 RepID=U5QGV7_GLOK1|nr:magnesium transporter [Gloeobacter kilaueensis]AGY58128.1 magnesium transporter [Gloeobacter kilaueensis JS1]
MLTQDRREALLAIEGLANLKYELNNMNPADAGDYIAALPPKEQALTFRLLAKGSAASVFEYLPSDVQEMLIESLHAREVQALVDQMSPDDRAELFDELPARVVKRLLSQLSPSEREATALILGYPEGTAGRVMTTEYVRLREDLSVAQAIQKIRKLDSDKETIYYAYLTDGERRLLGVVSLRQLLFAEAETPVQELAHEAIITVQTTAPQEEVARLLKRYDLLAVPVVDLENRLVGIVTVDDVVDILEEEATEDIQKLSGISGGDEQALSAPLTKVQKRLPWLLGNIVLYIGAASAIAPFQTTISLIPVLAVVMPILSNTSGNVGIQALSVTVRSLAVGEVSPLDVLRILRKEIQAGLLNALALGLALGALTLLWASSTERWVGLVAALVMALNVIVAASFGALLPMILKRFKQDPALVSGPLLTTLLDTAGFFTFLGLASLFIHQFKVG